jgi:hypothetical protein
MAEELKRVRSTDLSGEQDANSQVTTRLRGRSRADLTSAFPMVSGRYGGVLMSLTGRGCVKTP